MPRTVRDGRLPLRSCHLYVLNDRTGSYANAFPRQVLSRIMFILQPIMPHLVEEVLSRTHKHVGGVTASNVTWDDEVRPLSVW